MSDFLGYCAKSEGIVRPLMPRKNCEKKRKSFLEFRESMERQVIFESVRVKSSVFFGKFFEQIQAFLDFLKIPIKFGDASDLKKRKEFDIKNTEDTKTNSNACFYFLCIFFEDDKNNVRSVFVFCFRQREREKCRKQKTHVDEKDCVKIEEKENFS